MATPDAPSRSYRTPGTHPDPSKPYLLYTDSSDIAVGAYLAQPDATGREHLVRLACRRLLPSEKPTGVHVRELAAAVIGLDSFRSLVAGRDVTIITDSQVMSRRVGPIVTQREARLVERLLDAGVRVRQAPARDVALADLLSRSYIGVGEPVQVIAAIHPERAAELGIDIGGHADMHNEALLAGWRPAQEADAELSEVLQALRESGRPKVIRAGATDYTLLPNGLMAEIFGSGTSKRTRVCVPVAGGRRVLLLEAHHRLTGHAGARRTMASIRTQWTWPGLPRDARMYVVSCPVCARVRTAFSRSCRATWWR